MGCLIYIMNTPTDDMNNRIKIRDRVEILQRPNNLCYGSQCVKEDRLGETSAKLIQHVGGSLILVQKNFHFSFFLVQDQSLQSSFPFSLVSIHHIILVLQQNSVY